MAERNVGRPWTEHEGMLLLPYRSILTEPLCLDQLLKDAVAKHGEHDNWKNIALCIPGRSNKACRKVPSLFFLYQF